MCQVETQELNVRIDIMVSYYFNCATVFSYPSLLWVLMSLILKANPFLLYIPKRHKHKMEAIENELGN